MMEVVEHDKRQWLIVELLKEFLEVWLQFEEIWRRYRQGTLTFAEMARFIDDKDPHLPLFHLKEISHELFRQPTGDCPEEGRLFDLAVGSIFHEAMKARENLYQLQVYRPHYRQLEGRTEGASTYEMRLREEFAKIGRRAERGLREGLTETRRLFKDTLEQIRVFLTRHRGENPLLVRFLLQNETLLRRAYGRKGLEEIMAEAFPEGITAAYREGAMSFLRGEHFDLAARFFSRYLRHRPEDVEAHFLLLYCRGWDAYLKNRYRSSLRAFRQALRLVRDELRDRVKGFLEKMAAAVGQMARELQEEGRRRGAKAAFSLAEEIRVLAA